MAFPVLFAQTFSGKGFFAGGQGVYPDVAIRTRIEGIEFTTRTFFAVSAVLAVARYNLAGVNSLARGYFGGGSRESGWSAEIDGINFADTSAINPSAALAVARAELAASNSPTRGYFAGGTTGSVSAEIDGIQFSDESAINPSAVLSVARADVGSVTSDARGYFVAGVGASYTPTHEIDGIQYSDETAINPSATVAPATAFVAGANSPAKGYFLGGYAQTYLGALTFNTESCATISGALSHPRQMAVAVNSQSTAFVGGGGDGIASIAFVDGFAFSTESAFNSGASLANPALGAAGVQWGAL